MGSFAAPRQPQGLCVVRCWQHWHLARESKGSCHRPIRPTGRFEGRRDEQVCIKNNQERGNVGVAPPTASHWALRPRPLTCRRHWTGFSGNAQADNIFRTLFANKRIHILGGPNPPLTPADSHGLGQGRPFQIPAP
eukprot:scaffold2209_cov106-Isochrysis_galbana.AAC.2